MPSLAWYLPVSMCLAVEGPERVVPRLVACLTSREPVNPSVHGSCLARAQPCASRFSVGLLSRLRGGEAYMRAGQFCQGIVGAAEVIARELWKFPSTMLIMPLWRFVVARASPAGDRLLNTQPSSTKSSSSHPIQRPPAPAQPLDQLEDQVGRIGPQPHPAEDDSSGLLVRRCSQCSCGWW